MNKVNKQKYVAPQVEFIPLQWQCKSLLEVLSLDGEFDWQDNDYFDVEGTPRD